MFSLSARRATQLHIAGVECSETGNEDGAIENYQKALGLDPKRGDTLYNLGLIYKYRGAWRESFDFNRRAREFQPSDEATLWNLAIAATAREVWRALKVITEDGEGPINRNMGQTPVRVNAEDLEDRPIEVVWSERLCPVRSRLVNIPTGATGFRYGDIVLHDGAAVGYRLNSYGKERQVFNVLECSSRRGLVPMRRPSRSGTLRMLRHSSICAARRVFPSRIGLPTWSICARRAVKAGHMRGTIKNSKRQCLGRPNGRWGLRR